jgi:branched-chain amino acid transport system permease protein
MANAVRDNPERAEFLGYSARWVRYYSFCGAGFFAGVAGGLFAVNYEILTEENLNLATSGSILLVTFLGGAGFFAGPIIGAIVFTLLQTVLGLETDLWALYVGALFVVTVMFFPQGLTGLLAMHAPALRRGRLGDLVIPYLKTFLPGLVGLLGCAGLIEMIFHARNAAPGDEVMALYWMTFDSHGFSAWVVAAALGLGGVWLAARMAPEAKAAWDAANALEGAER